MSLSSRHPWSGLGLLVLPCALMLAPTAAAQARGRIDVTGAVLSNTLTAGPFVGLPAGTPVTMRVDVTVPGFEVQPDKYELYAIDTATSFVKAGDAQIAFKTGDRYIGLQDAYPVADGVHLEIMPMSPTYSMECEMWDGTAGQIWSSTDYELNAGFYGPELFMDISWAIMGGGQMEIAMHGFTIHPVSTVGTWLLDTPGLAAAGAKAPRLTADGAIAAGQPATFALTGAAPAAPIVFVVGTSAAHMPMKGGVLVPAPELLVLGIATDVAGQATLPGAWPLGLPAGIEFWFQAWIADAAAPAGYAASNGLHAIGG